MSSLSLPTGFTLAATDAIDLHMHTTYSDGHWAPAELFDYLAAHAMRLVAVTDHDRVDRIDEMQALGLERNIAVLAGVEVTTDWNGQMADLLCYGFDSSKGSLQAVTQQIVADQIANTRMVYTALVQQGYTFPRQNEVLASTNGELKRPVDNITLLREHGYVADYQSGLHMIKQLGFKSANTPLRTAVDAAHADGGVAVIAHPGRKERGFTLYTPSLLDEVRADNIPLDGIEVYYPLYTNEQTREYADYIVAHDWIGSCGSDSHGPCQRFPIPYQAQQANRLLARCGIALVA